MSEQGQNKGRTLSDLSEILFDQLDRLNDPNLAGEALEQELDRSKAVTSVAGQAISNANTMIRGWELKQAMSEGNAASSAPRLLGS